MLCWWQQALRTWKFGSSLNVRARRPNSSRYRSVYAVRSHDSIPLFGFRRGL